MSSKRALWGSAVVAALTLGLLLAAPAAARAPVIVSVGQQDRFANATWTLPRGVEASFVEVATDPEVSEFGYFRQRHLVQFDALRPNAASYQDTEVRLNPGTYYIHVAGEDRANKQCPPREFSAIMKLVITASGGGSGGVVREGSPPCPAPGGGGGGGGPGGGPVGGKRSPIASLSIKRVQDVDRLRVVLRLLERASVNVSATVRVAGAAKLYAFRSVKRTLPANVRTRLRLRIAKAKLRAIKRALRRGSRLRARIRVAAVADGGGRGVVTRRVRLKP
jgi:hypothetical protein